MKVELFQMYMEPVDRLTIYIGTRWGDRRFFTLDNFQGKSSLPHFPNDSSCLQTVKGSTEGLIYSQRLQKNSSLLYWRKTLCKVVALNYVGELLTVQGFSLLEIFKLSCIGRLLTVKFHSAEFCW